MYYFLFFVLCLCKTMNAHVHGAQEPQFPKVVSSSIGNALNHDDIDTMQDRTPPVGANFYDDVSSLPIDFFFQALYEEVQACNLQHKTVPYSFLINRPGIEVCFTKTSTGENVIIIDQGNRDRKIVIGSVPDAKDKNYILLNNETRYVPQIKKLYSLFLKEQSKKLITHEEDRQEILNELLRCPEIFDLYQKAGIRTTIYYLIYNELCYKKVRISRQKISDIIQMVERDVGENKQFTEHECVKYYIRIELMEMAKQFRQQPASLAVTVAPRQTPLFSAGTSAPSTLNPKAKAFTPSKAPSFADASPPSYFPLQPLYVPPLPPYT